VVKSNSINRTVPTYRWSCPACGQPNNAETSHCSACRCPVSFNATDVSEFRRKFLAQGGSVGQAAAQTLDENDFAALRLLLALPLLLLGWWPFRRNMSKAVSSKSPSQEGSETFGDFRK
jgi:hypothetical protein